MSFKDYYFVLVETLDINVIKELKKDYPKLLLREGIDVKDVLSVRKYKNYEVRDELIDGKEFGTKDVTMKSAYNESGDYIGDSKTAYRLAHDYKIEDFEKTSPKDSVCSIGFSPSKNKWYGWSHRAIYGFTKGSKCKKGDCGYNPKKGEWTAKNMDDAKQMAIDFANGVS